MVLAFYPEAYDEKTGEMTAPRFRITGSMKGNRNYLGQTAHDVSAELSDYEENVGSILCGWRIRFPLHFWDLHPGCRFRMIRLKWKC